MSFFVNLKFNSDFPGNKLSDFTSYVYPPLSLNEPFEVGLVEIFFPINYFVDYGQINVKLPSYMARHSESIESHFIETGEFSIKDEERLVNSKIEKIKQTLNEEAKLFRNDQNKYLNDNANLNNAFKKYFEKLKNQFEFITQLVREFSIKNANVKKLFDIFRSNVQMYLNYYEKLNFEDTFLNEIKNLQNSLTKFLENEYNDFSVQFNLHDRISKKNFIYNFFLSFSTMLNTSKLANKINFKDDISFKFDKYFSNLIRLDLFTSAIHLIGSDPICVVKFVSISTDIIEERKNLEESSQELRTFKLEGFDGDFLEKSFERINYFAVKNSYINKIRIQIKDQHKKLLNFQSGPILVKLHFRKIK